MATTRATQSSAGAILPEGGQYGDVFFLTSGAVGARMYVFGSGGWELENTARGLVAVGGTVVLDGLNPTPVVTGLTTITSAVVTIKSSVSPATTGNDPGDVYQVTATWTSGTLNIYAWYQEAVTAKLLASTNAAITVSWIAIGS